MTTSKNPDEAEDKFPWLLDPIDPADSRWWVSSQVPFEAAIMAVQTTQPVFNMGDKYAYDILEASDWPSGLGRIVHINEGLKIALGYIKVGETFLQVRLNPSPRTEGKLIRLPDWVQQQS